MRLRITSFKRKNVLIAGVWTTLALVFFAYLYYSEMGTFPQIVNHWHMLLTVVLTANFVGWCVRKMDHLIDQWMNWRSVFFTRFVFGFITNLIVTTAIVGISSLLFFHLWSTSTVEAFYAQWREEIWKLGILLTLTIMIYEIFYGWYYSYRYYMTTQVEHLRSERVQLELQFESLKNQISPHYLFNCLNTISSLLYRENGEAEEFIRRMADTFKYVLSNRKQRLVTIREEIEFVKAYYYLLQVRYHSNLQLDINLPSNVMQSLVPPLAVQMLVENAVKHNEISKDHPLFVYISAQDNTYINVSSTKTESAKETTSFKIGLDNVRSRYQFFTDEKVVVKNDKKFFVQLPIIKPGLQGVTIGQTPALA